MTKQEAIKWHMENVLKYAGYGKANISLTEEEATAEVEYRMNNKLNLTGFNSTPQEKWTY